MTTTAKDTPVSLGRDVEPLALHPWRSGGREALSSGTYEIPDFTRGADVRSTLDWAVRIGPATPVPGGGDTAALWELLAEVARRDVTAARIVEPHLDALAILAQARAAGIDVTAALSAVGAGDDASWGVFAAEGPDARLEASSDGNGGWRLRGRKPWCSLAGELTHALITAWIAPDARGLFAVSLRERGVTAQPGPWFARGLSEVVSAPVDFDGVAAAAIGEPGWYLSRPGFDLGGIGVAAVWWGGAVPLYDALLAAAARPGADQLAAAYAGAADAALWATRAVLAEAAQAADADLPAAEIGRIGARARAVTADAVERVLTIADHALGPGPLTADEEHARRVADLRIYTRQHHAERDLARLGRKVTP